MLNNEDRFLIAAEKERLAFRQMKKQLNLFNDCQIYLTPAEGKEVYDGTMIRLNDGSKVKSYIMEFKVRNFHIDMETDGFFLETKKLQSLKRLNKKWQKELYLDKDEYDILYFSFTEHYTMCWNLTKMEAEGKLYSDRRSMNKATMESTTNKIDKGVYLLKIEDGKKINFKWDEIYYQQYISPPPASMTIREVVKAVGIQF